MHTLKYKTGQLLNRLYSRKKRLLCYGDSNTWGYIPGSAGRYTFNQRWPGVLQNELVGRARVFEDGLSGRTTIYDDPFEKNLNGEKHLLAALKRCTPLDLVILMLGTNDLKSYFLCRQVTLQKVRCNYVKTYRSAKADPAAQHRKFC